MKKKTHRYQKQEKTPAMAIFLGCGVCILSFFGIMLLSAILILATKNPLTYSDSFSPLAFAAAGALAGLIGRRFLGTGRLFLFCPALTLLLALLAGIFLSGGKIALSALLSELIFLGASYLFFYLARERSARKKHRH